MRTFDMYDLVNIYIYNKLKTNIKYDVSLFSIKSMPPNMSHTVPHSLTYIPF